MCTKNGSYCEKEKKSGGGGGGQGGCEWRSEAFVKIQKKYIFLMGGGGGVGAWVRGGGGVRFGGGGGQGGWEQRSEACVKIQKKKNFWGGGFGLGGGGGVRVDVNGEVKLL